MRTIRALLIACAAIPLAVWVVCTLGGCVGWQPKARATLVQLHKAGKLTLDAAGQACKPFVALCVAKGDMLCPGLQGCQERRRPVYALLEHMQTQLLMGFAAVEMGSVEGAAEAAARAANFLQQAEAVIRGVGSP